MTANAVIDIVIGLILLYLLLALLCTIINEFLASLLKLRAGNLAKTIEQIIDDPNLRKAVKETGLMGMSGKASGRKGPSYVPSRDFALAVLQAIEPAKPITERQELKDIQSAIEKLPASKIKDTLASFTREAAEDVEAYRKRIAIWFDDMMDRASGVYKRRTQLISLVVAFLLAVAVNADSVQVARALWVDSTLRTHIAENAAAVVRDTGKVEDLADIDAITKELRPLPIGWDYKSPGSSDDWFRSFWSILQKLFGLLFTAAAVSLGAPFWFDLLNKFTRMRGSGKPPPKEEEAKPRAT